MCGRCRTRIPGDCSAMHPKGRELPIRGISAAARIQDDDVIWWFTDQGLAALDLNALMQSAEGRDN